MDERTGDDSRWGGEQRTGLEIAIVGLAGRFPGAPDLTTYWRNLRDGVESIRFFSDEELISAGVDPELLSRPEYVRAHGALDAVDRFDAGYFGVAPREAEVMDPQHRIFLELVVEALERAGYASGAQERVVGVYAGASENSYFLSNLLPNLDLLRSGGGIASMTGIQKDFLATRVSYKLNLRGPSLTVQTACSTSLVAVHLACQALLSGECDVAVAGGVAIRVPQTTGYLLENDTVFSPDGHCRSFDAMARGTVAGSGAGVVVLRRLSDAEADGDPIEALIRGTVTNNDGAQKAGFTAPSVDGQAAVVRTAHLVAEVDPSTVTYLEAHGTATPLGDPIEVAALCQAFDAEPGTAPFCALSSVKSNIGHLDAAAGVAGLIKTVLALQHGQKPPTLHFERPNPQIDFGASPFYVKRQIEDWPRNGAPRRAGVSAFGIGGTNAHVVLEEAPPRESSGPARPYGLLPISARTRSALEKLTDELAEHLRAHPELPLADAAYTLQVGRWPLPHRRVILASGRKEAVEALAERDPRRTLEHHLELEKETEVFFLFSGLGDQASGMGRELYEGEPTFREAVDRCCEILRPHLGLDLRELLYPADRAQPRSAGVPGAPFDLRDLRRRELGDADGTAFSGATFSGVTAALERTALAQPAVFVLGHALCELWQEWGVRPAGAMGYSLGEYLAAHRAGVFSLEDALGLVAERARLIEELPPGKMLAVPLAAVELAAKLDGELTLAATAAPCLSVAAGPPEAVFDLSRRLRKEGVTARLLATAHAFHTPMMRPAAEPFARALRRVELRAPELPYISNVTGTWIRPDDATDPDYWVRHLLEPVRFRESAETLLSKGGSALLEIGPGQTLGTFVLQSQSEGQRETPVVASSLPPAGAPDPQLAHLLRGLGKLWTAGVPMDWSGFSRHERRCRVALPTYPFERQRYWIEAPTGTPAFFAPPTAKGAGIPPQSSPVREPGISDPGARATRDGIAPRPSLIQELGNPDPGARNEDGAPTEAPDAKRRNTDRGSTERAQNFRASGPGTPYQAPQTTLEWAITGIWQDVLGLSRVGVHDDFFELGGHSLLATRVLSRLREIEQVELSLGRFFAARTIAALARVVAELRPDREAPSREEKDREGTEEQAAAALEPEAAAPSPEAPSNETNDAGVLSFAQERLWFLDQLEPGSAFYNLPAALVLRGELDAEALRRAFEQVVRRHDMLRARFAERGGRPHLVISDPAARPLPAVDLRALPEPSTAAHTLAVREARRPFDLARQDLLRTVLLRLGPREYLLFLNLHHIVSDAWSIGVMTRELAVLYGAFRAGAGRGETVPDEVASLLPALPIRYADFAAGQRRSLVGETLERQLAFWRERLSGVPVLELPADRPRPAAPSNRGAARLFFLPEELAREVRRLGHDAGATLFMTLLAVFQVLLYRLSGQRDFAVGTPIANRHHHEVEGLVGFFVNTLVLRARLVAQMSFADLLDRVRKEAFAAYAHQDLPFERLVDRLGVDRDLAHSPLFQVMFAVQEEAGTIELAGLEAESLELDVGTVKFDLTLSFFEGSEDLPGILEYATDLFDETTAARLGRRFARLLASIVSEPARSIGDLALLSAPERHQTLLEWNATSVAVRARSTDRLFAARAAAMPERTAVLEPSAGGGAPSWWSYAELERRAEGLAFELRARGVGPGNAVAVEQPRSAGLVITILAAWKTGAAYVPIDPTYPEKRRRFMAQDAGAACAVTGVGRHTARIRMAAGPRRSAAPLLGSGGSRDAVSHVIYTSGSTGRPKGVAILHRSVLALLDWAHKTYDKTELAGVLASTSISFDLSVFELFAPLTAGGRAIVVDDVLALTSLGADFGVTLVNTVPSAAAELLRSDALPFTVRTLNLAGEALSPELARRILERRRPGAGPPRLWNLYGPSEDTTYSTASRIEGELIEAPPIGRPLAGGAAYVLDRRLLPVPPGTPGELCLTGPGMALGYVRRPAATAAVFVPHPRGRTPGVRLYRTGDRVRQRLDGQLLFLGRIDHQVKVRGFRLEPGEVEAALCRHPDLRAAVVVARGDAAGDRRLVAYLVPREGAAAPSLSALRLFLGDSLPRHMLPSARVALAALPLTPGGKVDRRALPEPEIPTDVGATGPRNAVEEILEGIWWEVLGEGSKARIDRPPRIDVHTSFFDLGGHSLLATRVSSRIRGAFGVDLGVRRLFERPTIAALAEEIEVLRGAPSSPEASQAEAEPPLRRGWAEGPVAPLSFAQERLWFLAQLEPQSAFYHLPAALLLRGALDTAALERALEAIVHRHDGLRTRFEDRDARPVAIVRPPTPRPLLEVDLTALASAREEAARLVAREARRPFDLARHELVRSALFALAPRENVLFLHQHHIVSDGWSIGILARELGVLYDAFCARTRTPDVPLPAEPQTPLLPELPVRYADFAVWQRRWLAGPVKERQLAYWQDRLRDLPPLELAGDRPRPPVPSDRGGIRPLRLRRETAEEMRRFSRASGATLFMTSLSIFQVWLYRLSGQHDFAVGTPVANRQRQEIEGLMGFFVNTLVLRAELSPRASLREVLGRARRSSLDAYAHQDLPFEHLVDQLGVPRDLARSPLFQVMLTLEQEAAIAMEGLAVEAFPFETGTVKLDLTLALVEVGEELQGGLEYAADLFDATTADRLAAAFSRLAAEALAQPERPIAELAMLGLAERHQLLAEWNDHKARSFQEDQPRTLPALFTGRVRATPDAVALRCGDETLSYGALGARVAALALRLRSRGVGPEGRVALAVDRGPEMVIGTLGVLATGAAYVPVDPGPAPNRRRRIFREAGTDIILKTSDVLAPIPWASVALPGATPAHPEQLCYVVYTSGSTGRPKGVMIPHAAVMNLHAARRAFVAQEGPRTVALLAPLVFDAFLDPLLALCDGHPLEIVPEDLLRDAEALVELFRDRRLGTFDGTPAQLAALVEAGLLDDAASAPAQALIGGEALPADLWERLRRAPQIRAMNLYGPTEATVEATWTAVAGSAARPHVGRPLAGVSVQVLDPRLRSVPLGIPGEVGIGGAGLARGYLARPGRTAERFVPDPRSAAGARLYLTGDRGRFLPGGRLELLGRLDRQVKVRGYRIEPGEVEAALRRHPELHPVPLKRCAVVVPAGTSLLVAYVVRRAAAGDRLAAGSGPDGGKPSGLPVRSLQEQLRKHLPEYMIPTRFLELDELPSLPSGKVDRAALARRPLPAAGKDDDAGPPRSPAEEIIAGIWRHVLGLETIGVRDDFFALGGHSLLATRVVSRLREAFGKDLAVREIFEAPTVEALAARLDSRSSVPPTPASSLPDTTAFPVLEPSVLEPFDGEGPPPLSFAQERLWFLWKMLPGNPFYNVPTGLLLRGELDVNALRRTLSVLVRRHPMLRTRFPERDGRPVQVVEPASPRPLPVADLGGLLPRRRAAETRRLLAREGRRPFDVEVEPPFRVLLLRLGAREHALLLFEHHIVSDAGSVDVLVRDLSSLYASFRSGTPAPRGPESGVRYADFAVWQRRALEGSALDLHLAYWKTRLGGTPPLELPVDRPRPAVTSYRGAQWPFVLPARLYDALGVLSRSRGATLFMTLLAAFKGLLSRFTAESDLAVGTPASHRDRPELEGVVGLFLNTLVLRTEVASSSSFAELLSVVREACLEAYAHQALPFERLVDELDAGRDLARTPLFQAMFVFQSRPAAELRLPGLELEALPADTATAKVDLTLLLAEGEDHLLGSFEYATDLFDATTLARLAQQWRLFLDQLLDDPERPLAAVALLGAAQRQQVLREWNDTARKLHGRERPIHALVAERARRSPSAIAVVAEDSSLSYAELDARAESLARHLRELGVGPDVRVALLMDRSLDMARAVLGVLQAGGAVVPLDPTFPEERLATMLADAEVEVLVTRSDLATTLPADGVRTVCLDRISPDWAQRHRAAGAKIDPREVYAENLFYVIFTSGSTGRPKGIGLSHGVLRRLTDWHLDFLGHAPPGSSPHGRGVHVVQFASLSFDISFYEMFAAWGSGGTLHLIGEALRRDVAELARFVAARRLDELILPASALEVWSEEPAARRSSLATLVSTGEALRVTPSLAALFAGSQRTELQNHYGPAETHVTAAWRFSPRWPAWAAPRSHRVPVGQPIAHTRIHLLDRRFRAVPAGVTGELGIAGEQLARGYLRAGATAARFLPDPWSDVPGGRLYRAGDLGRRRSDGVIELLGRRDHQVKIRGHRVEPGEIEAVLLRHPDVVSCAVVAPPETSGSGTRRLVAYAVTDRRPPPAILRQHLADRLPAYMLPTVIVDLPELPLLPNGKIDRRALEGRSRDELAAPLATYVAPRNKREKRLAALWSEVLGRDTIGVLDNFFDLGGHSLLIVRLLSRVHEVFGRRLPVLTLFEHSTVAALAEQLVETAPYAGAPTPPPLGLAPATDALSVRETGTSERAAVPEIAGTPASHARAAVRRRGLRRQRERRGTQLSERSGR